MQCEPPRRPYRRVEDAIRYMEAAPHDFGGHKVRPSPIAEPPSHNSVWLSLTGPKRIVTKRKRSRWSARVFAGDPYCREEPRSRNAPAAHPLPANTHRSPNASASSADGPAGLSSFVAQSARRRLVVPRERLSNGVPLKPGPSTKKPDADRASGLLVGAER